MKKIRIISAQRQTYWYADKIGQVFKVIDEQNDAFLVDYNEENKVEKYYVFKEDAELVKI